MVLTKRERYVLIGTCLAVGALALDRFVVSPLLDRRAEAEAQRTSLTRKLNQARALLERQRLLTPRWQEMLRTGMKSDPAESESQVLHALRNWAEECGITLSLLKPERLTEKSRLPQIAFQASGSGNMNAVARLLWRIQTAGSPLRATEVQISARKEGSDDLSFQLRLSTVYSPSPTAKPAPADGKTGAPGGS
ncbi:MAG TPA: hypothetical protein DCX07_09585 [Phycisphaerales bacterium]|nr:hypothetical protein [Phycisphaerales bacterium]